MSSKDKMIDLIIFPSSFFDTGRVDEDLQSEYDAVKATRLFDTILFGYEKWFQHEKLFLSESVEEKRTAIYRGWMMKPEQYCRFFDALLEKNIELITSPEAYEQMHVFPNAYSYFRDDTAKMMIFPLHEQIDVEILKDSFERFMVKDYVKSVKGTSFPQFFDHSVNQEDFDKWMDVFYEYRGELLTGGICIKDFLNLKKYDERTNEYRVFYINHEPATVSRNSGQIPAAPEVPQNLVEKYKNLPSPYYTVDYAELEDDTWKVIESGDGSVSGLSEGQDAEAYYRALYHCMNR